MSMFATSDGTKLYYEDTGKGPTLVFCHGLNSSHLAIKKFIDEFRGEWRCIVDMTLYMRNGVWRGGIGCGSWTDEDFMQDFERMFDDVGQAAWQIVSRLVNPALGASTPPAMVGTMAAAFGANIDPLVMTAFWYSLFRTDQRPAISKINVPFQYIKPETPLYGDVTIDFYRQNLGGPFRLETGFPGTTHSILEESPREVASRVKAFLRGDVQ